MNSPREYFRQLYFKSRPFRWLAPWLIDDRPVPIDFSHLRSFREEQIGPLQRDEALALFGLTRALCPRTIVEFGFLHGHSALNFLLAADPDCRIFSYDIDDKSQEISRRCFGHFKNFRFLKKSQVDFSPFDIENRKIDICFLDASHDISLNLRTFDLIHPHLSETAVMVVHDTGVWQRKFLKSKHYAFIETELGKGMGRWIDSDRFQPVVEERRFLNALLLSHPDFSQIHLHSTNTLRHGLTLLQRQVPLVTELEPKK